MRYTKKHKSTSRKGILASALKLFSYRGFDNVSIDEIMANTGLTRGAFYAHFESKQELYSEAILSSEHNNSEPTADLTNGLLQLKQFVTDYLDADYSDPDVLPCPLAYLITDVAIREQEVRSAYATSFESLNSNILALLSKSASSVDKETILALTSMMIGSVSIARTIPDPTLSKKILSSCKKHVLKIIDDT